MDVIQLERNVLHIQKCLMPVCDFQVSNFGKYVEIRVPEVSYSYIAKVGLCEHKNLLNCCSIDFSVLKFVPPLNGQELHNQKYTQNLKLTDLQVLPSVQVAKRIEVSVIFTDVSDINKVKSNKNLIKEILTDILKLYVFSVNSIVFFKNLSKLQDFNLFGIIVENVQSKTEASVNQPFKVTSTTQVFVKKLISKYKFESQQEKPSNDELAGLEKVYHVLQNVVQVSKSQPCVGKIKLSKNLLLVGPPGSGKTTLVHKMSKDFNLVLLKILTSDINTSEPGETEKLLKEIFYKAKSHAEIEEDCLILIEEIDSVCISTDNGSSSHSKRVLQQLISLIESTNNIKGIVVVATTNAPEDVDVQLRRPGRFDEETEIMIPSESDRLKILCSLIKSYKAECAIEVLKKVSSWTPGYVAADLQSLVSEALGRHYQEKYDLESCFLKATAGMTPTSLKGTTGLTTGHETTFSEIGGLSEIKRVLNFCVTQQLTHPQIFKRLGIPQTKGILLYGPPGCAKTSLVKALARENNTTFLAISAADLYSPFVGDAERSIVKLFSQARIGAPAIIFIDEIDALVGSKSLGRERGVQERVLSTLLVEMDGIGLTVRTLDATSRGSEEHSIDYNDGIIVVGATNRPDMLDDALLRPGRFDKLLYVPAPTESDRLNILETITKNMSLDSSINLHHLARHTEFFSGADLKNLCYESGLHALACEGMNVESIKQSHFENVLNVKSPSLNCETIKMYENYKYK